MAKQDDDSMFPGLDAHETNLVLYIDNTGEMYDDYKALLQRLIKAKKAGDFSSHAAQQAFENRVAQGMRRYQRELRSRETWTPAQRTKIAKHYLEQFEHDYQSGELEWLGGPSRPPRGARANPEKLTAADIEAAPMFTVFGGNRGRGNRIRDNRLPANGPMWIVAQIDSGIDEDVEREMKRREIYGDIGDVIQRDDDEVNASGRGKTYDDNHAAADANYAGYTLVKIPDAMPGGVGDRYYRIYVLDKPRESRNRWWYEPLDDNQIDWLTGKKERPRASGTDRRGRR